MQTDQHEPEEGLTTRLQAESTLTLPCDYSHAIASRNRSCLCRQTTLDLSCSLTLNITTYYLANLGRGVL